ncbi:hypothetical protein EV122DRAFT_211989 [Schizophyllum commune]
MAPTQSGRAGEPTAAPQQRQSERFCSTDGDIVIFRSCDGVLFNIHRANLRAVTDGPFAEDFVSSATDVADLTEHSDILKIIFQFVYPGNLPLLEDVPPSFLFLIAEAAEKYRVAPAMAVCHLKIQGITGYLSGSFVLQKMAYAYRHGYIELMDEAAPGSLKKTSQNALEIMGVGILYIAWTLYKEAWTKIFTKNSYMLRMQNHHGLTNVECEAWTALVYAVERGLGEDRTSSPNALHFLFFGKEEIAEECKHLHDSGTTHCRHQLTLWKDTVAKEAKRIPPLSYFVSAVKTG